MSSTANRVIKNTGYLYLKMGITMFISLYTTRLILGSLGAEDFGIFNIVGGAIAMLGFLNAAMAAATQRFLSFSQGEGNAQKQTSIFNISIVLHTAIALAVGVVLLGAGYFFFNGMLNIPPDRIFAAKVVYGSLIVSTMFTVMSVPYDATLNAHENMKYYAIVGVFESLLKLAVAIAVVHTSGDKLIRYGVLMACIPLVTLTIMRIYCHRHYGECRLAPRRHWDRPLAKQMAGFAGWSFAASSTSMVGNYGMGIVLNIFFGVVLNAAQGIAGQLSGQLNAFTQTMLKALNPVIAKSLGANDYRAMQRATLVGSKYAFLITAFFVLPVIFEAPFILRIWLKDVPVYAVVFVQLQLTRTLIEQLTITLSAAVQAQGDIRNFSIWQTVLNLLPLPLIYLVFWLGASPVYMYIIAIAVWSFGGGTIKILFARRKNKIDFGAFFQAVLSPCLQVCVPVLLCGGCITAFFPQGWARLLGTLVFCSLVYACFFWLRTTDGDERKEISKFFLSIKQNFS